MWVLDRDTLMFLQVNEAAIGNYGYSGDEFLAMSLTDIKLETDRSTLADNLKTNAETGDPVRLVTRHRRKNQEQFDAEVVFNSILFKGKHSILAIMQDISAQVSYIKAIERQNKKLHEIAYIQSHHVRAPLARIMGLVYLITQSAGGKPDQQLLGFLDQSAKDLDQVILEITGNTVEQENIPE